jgi:hypothetical protein
MKRSILVLTNIVIGLLFLYGCKNETTINVIPKPYKTVLQPGTFLLTRPVKLFINSDELLDIGKYFSDYIKSSLPGKRGYICF